MLYRFAYAIIWLILTPLFRYQINGRHNIPKEGPVIIAANHSSYIDPLLVVFAASPRQVNFMAKAELLKIPVFGSLLKALNTFPVKRGVADKGAIAHSLKLLSEGKILLIFPEGTRVRNGQGKLGQAYPGATAIALKSGVPIIPVGLIGTSKIMPEGARFPRFVKLKVRVGSPIKVGKVAAPERKEKEAELTAKIMEEISKLIAGG